MPTKNAPIVERVFGFAVRAVSDEKRSIDVVASTDSVDSYDEIVEQDWDLDRYKANPVVLWNHNRGAMSAASPDAALPIGVASNVAVKNGELLATLSFVDAAANPIAERIWQGVKQGSLRAVSVGFRPRSVRQEKRDGKDIIVLSQNELHEISVVPIPANPDAVARAKALEELRAFARDSVSKPAADEAQETTMADENVKEQLAEEKAARKLAEKAAETAKAEADERVKAFAGENATLRTELATRTAERDAAVERAAKAEDAVLESEVEALVGAKITPAEKGTFLKLAKSNKELFAEMVAGRADLGLGLKGGSVLGSKKDDVGKPVSGAAASAAETVANNLLKAAQSA